MDLIDLGHNGANRVIDPKYFPKAGSDRELLSIWLDDVAGESCHTLAMYARDLGKLFIWAARKAHKAVSDLDAADMHKFAAFLVAPDPAWVARSCGRRAARGSPGWRPLAGPAKFASLHAALVSVSAFFNYGIACEYFRRNPVARAGGPTKLTRKALGLGGTKSLTDRTRLRRIRVRPKGMDLHRNTETDVRTLNAEQKEAMLEALQRMPHATASAQPQEDARWQRFRFLLTLLYTAAPRVSDVVAGRMKDIVQDARGGWWWQVLDGRKKTVLLPLTSEFMSVLADWRVCLGFNPVPAGEDFPLIPSMIRWHAGRALNCPPLTVQRINQLLQALGQKAAAHYASQDKSAAFLRRLRKQTVHTWRRTALIDQRNTHIPDWIVQANARHSDIATTRYNYPADDQAKRHDTLERTHRLGVTTTARYQGNS